MNNFSCSPVPSQSTVTNTFLFKTAAFFTTEWEYPRDSSYKNFNCNRGLLEICASACISVKLETCIGLIAVSGKVNTSGRASVMTNQVPPGIGSA